MDLDRMKERWQSTAGTPPPASPDLLRSVAARAATLHRQVRQRDWVETAAGVLVSAMFAAFAVSIRQPVARTGAILVSVACVFVAVHLYRVRTRRPTPQDATLRAHCERELQKVNDQIRLLRSVAWWYLAPLVGSSLVFSWGLDSSVTSKVVYTLCALFLSLGIYALNQRAVRRQLLPVRDALRDTLAQFDTPDR